MNQYFVNNVINVQPMGMPGSVPTLFGGGMNAATTRCLGVPGLPQVSGGALAGGGEMRFFGELMGLMVGLLERLMGVQHGAKGAGKKKPHHPKPHHPSPHGAASPASFPRQVGGAPHGTFHARGTGYYPANNAMEGGFVDKRGHKLHTLQDYLAGKAPYVSVAMDSSVPYGSVLRIPQLEKKYHRPIVFRAVDTGGAFQGTGHSRVDICVRDQQASYDSTINGPLTLNFV